MLEGFVDGLLQTFENSRLGLADETLRKGGAAVEPFFLELYKKETPRLREIIERQEHLPAEAREDLFARVDERVRQVVIPAYARLSGPLALRERNDFYLVSEPWHGAERLGWGVAGIALGAFVVWAPFIPLWEKEWILPFAVAGLFFPNIRRYLALGRYQSELNRLVAKTDDEIWRMDLAYWTRDSSRQPAPVEDLDPGVRERLLSRAPNQGPPQASAKTRLRQGGS